MRRMIFVTVGTQLPFDRLILAMDRWAAAHPEVEVIAQTGAGAAPAAYLHQRAHLSAAEFGDLVRRSDLVVAHAGMGSILTALDLGRRVVVLPRRAAFGEHRNDHQLATAAGLSHLASLRVAMEAEELPDAIRASLEAGKTDGGPNASSDASPTLLKAVRSFIEAARGADAKAGEEVFNAPA